MLAAESTLGATGAGAAFDSPADAPAALAGIALHGSQLPRVLADGVAADLVEVRAVDALVDGVPRLQQLERLRARWPLSLHGLGLPIGGEGRLDEGGLARASAWVGRLDPILVGERLALRRLDGRGSGAAQAIAFDRPSLRRVIDQVDQLQHRLRRRVLLEPVRGPVGIGAAALDEDGFLGELVRRTGCAVRLDLAGARAIGGAGEPLALVDALPAGAVAAIDLGGTHRGADDAPRARDANEDRREFDETVWARYGRAIMRLGAVPTVIARGIDPCPLPLLEADAARARGMLAAHWMHAGVLPHAASVATRPAQRASAMA